MKLKKFSFVYKRKKFKLDVQECKTPFEKMQGLMFRRHSPPLLFYFNQLGREPIHSFFCVPFIAVWFNKDKIVDVKFVKPWKFSVLPKQKFDRLLEVPRENKNFKILVEALAKI